MQSGNGDGIGALSHAAAVVAITVMTIVLAACSPRFVSCAGTNGVILFGPFGDLCPLADRDGDGVHANVDVDDDNDGLIEINFLEDLDFMRYDLDGTHYDDDGAGEDVTIIEDDGSNAGCPAGGCNGYELARDLDFSAPASYRSGEIDLLWIDGAGPNTGWPPIADNSSADATTRFRTVFDGNGNTITNLLIARDVDYIGLFGYIDANGTVRNLTVRDARVSQRAAGGDSFVGSVAGNSDGAIEAVVVDGGAADGGDGIDQVGGLVGENRPERSPIAAPNRRCQRRRWRR